MKNKRNIVYAVGINYNGGFGVGNNNDSTTISRLEWSNKINIIKIYNGYYFTIYKDDNNILYAAGDNTKGSCLQDKSKEKITTLMKVAGLPNIQISNVYCNPAWNSYHGFIVSKDNMIYAFGGNEKGQLGIGNARNVYKVHGIKWKYDKIKQIQCAAYYSIILTNKGCVYSTDFSNSGGNAQKVYNSNGTKQWTQIKSLKNITNIAAGHQHTLCVNANGNIYAFGWNGKGALGLNKKDDKENHNNPTLIPFFSSQHIRIINVYCGSSHSLALSQTGTVYCWGDNFNGQCGHGYATKRDDPILEPKQIESLKNNKIKNIVTGYVHSAAITTTNEIFMFGRNGYNQCIIPTYNAAKDNPIEITQYIFLKFKKYIIDITLGQNNTKLILSDSNSQNNNLENEEKEFDEYKQTHQNDQINNNDKKLEKDRKEKEALQKRLKETEEKLKKQEKEFAKSKMKKYNDEIVNELVKMGVGSRDECIAASYMVLNPNDINEVTNKIYDLQNKQTGLSYSMENDEKTSETSMSSFENQILQLLNIIKEHFNFMNKQEQTVNAMINKSGQQRTKLQNAKTKSIETEKNLLNQITEISAINNFLTDIILIENLFNSEYSNELKLKQENARNKYAKTIPIYEQKPKPICNITSFVDLLFQAYTDITAFKQWLKSLQNECGQQNIKMISKPEAKQKNIERAFYKTFYVYAIQYPNNAHQRLTDVLRCSLVFEEFDDLYKCFAIIEKLSEKDGGILRCKDRFNLETIPFGYRDLLININCPASNGQVVCEVQLHHTLFSKHKQISHNMYKKARLFEKNGKNLAYEYANKYIRKNVGDKKYEYENDGKQSESEEMRSHRLLKEWNLDRYAEVLIDDEGYDDCTYWKDLSVEELKQMGFKTGHAKKFIDKCANI